MKTIRPLFANSSSKVRCAVSTRIGGVSPPPLDLNLSYNVGDDKLNVEKNRKLFFGSLEIGLDRLAIPQQIHSNIVRRADKPGLYPSCDALITNAPGVYLCVTVADCLPLLVYDPARHAVAAVHAGWRGSSSQITARAVGALCGEYGSSPEELLVFIGPAAGVCCYEVGPDVARQFDPNCTERRDGKVYLNLRAANLKYLADSGVLRHNVEVSSQCTICEPSTFHSFRREKDQSGRMMGVIGLAP